MTRSSVCCIGASVLLSIIFVSAAWATHCTGDIAEDDAEVSVADLLVLLENWNTDGPGSGIAEPDDIVNVADLIGLLSQWGSCPFQPCGDSDAGNCFQSNGTPGCQDDACCTAVCEVDPFCCDTLWGIFCIAQANDLCGDAACPGQGDCFTAGKTPGCAIESCCNVVCGIDAFCCDVEWDGACVEMAHTNCIDSPQTGTCCLPNGECVTYFNNGQCSISGGVFHGADVSCNDIKCGDPACPGEGNCFFANDVPGCDDEECCNKVCNQDVFCCDTQWDSECAEIANDLCGKSDCPGFGDCFENNGSLSCDDEACCNAVCDIDPFCCLDLWDGICAQEAFALCTDCGDPNTGSCFKANGAPRCDDAMCCGTVCAQQPFCCETEWDCQCVALAGEVCCGGANAGDCFHVNGTTGCDDDECCTAVCKIDQFCCLVDWDAECADTALDICR
jgi:hypothetical protein